MNMTIDTIQCDNLRVALYKSFRRHIVMELAYLRIVPLFYTLNRKKMWSLEAFNRYKLPLFRKLTLWPFMALSIFRTYGRLDFLLEAVQVTIPCHWGTSHIAWNDTTLLAKSTRLFHNCFLWHHFNLTIYTSTHLLQY